MERAMLGMSIGDRMTNEEIRKRTKVAERNSDVERDMLLEITLNGQGEVSADYKQDGAITSNERMGNTG